MLTVTRAAMLGLALLIPPAASAQSEATGQLWGNGYRHNRHWQTAALYIRTNSRNTIDEPFTTSENVLDLQLKRVW